MPSSSSTMRERLLGRFDQRAVSAVLALALEALFVLALLTLGRSVVPHEKEVNETLVSITPHADSEAKKPAKPEQQPKASAKPVPHPERQKEPEKPNPREPKPAPPMPRATPQPPVLLSLSHDQMASADISALGQHRAPAAKPMMGPVDDAPVADTPRVGTAPNGQPLYAAAWYREPYDDELSGYLSTASGPGWGLIACRTEPEYRVDHCVALDEYPTGSNIARAVLAAAWQFRVRPPMLGGQPQIGDWVRIRIDYGMRPKQLP